MYFSTWWWSLRTKHSQETYRVHMNMERCGQPLLLFFSHCSACTQWTIKGRRRNLGFCKSKNNDSQFQTFAMFWMLYSFFWVIPRCMNFMCQHFGTLCQFHLHRWCKMELTECSETSAHKIQTPENHPKERIQEWLLLYHVNSFLALKPEVTNTVFKHIIYIIM